MDRLAYNQSGNPYDTPCYGCHTHDTLMSNECIWIDIDNIFGSVRSFCNKNCYNLYLEEIYPLTHCTICDADLSMHQAIYSPEDNSDVRFCSTLCSDTYHTNQDKIKAEKKAKREDRKWAKLRKSSVIERFKLMEID